MNRADVDENYPSHCRTSCSDADLYNVDPSGSAGCERCTAIAITRGEEMTALLRRLVDAWEEMGQWPGTPEERQLLGGIVADASSMLPKAVRHD